MVYLSTLPRRRRNGYRMAVRWPDVSWELHGRDVRRIYRQLRDAGLDPMSARWIVFDLVSIGTRGRLIGY